MVSSECALTAVCAHEYAHIFSGISQPWCEPYVVPGFSGGKVVSRSLKRHRRKCLEDGRDYSQTCLAHLLSTLGVVTITFAQQQVCTLDVFAHEAHRHHRPIPLEFVRHRGKDER